MFVLVISVGAIRQMCHGRDFFFLKDDTFQSCTNLEFSAEKNLKGGPFKKSQNSQKKRYFYCSKARRRRENKSKTQNRHNQKLPLKRVMGGIIFFSKDDTFGTCTND